MLDRIVTLSIQGEGGRNEYGEWEESRLVEHRIWATRMDKSLEDIENEGGTRNIARRDFRVRWFSDLATALPSSISVTEGGQTFDVENITEESEGHGRRRFMVLECVAEVAA